MDAQYPPEIQQLPIAPYLDALCTSLSASPSRFLILTAETAAGKSTAVPLALLRHFSGKILILEPRRLAALAVASRVAGLLGEETGDTAGYIMHLESRVSSRTRCIVMTEAVLTRMIQDDPSLEGVSVVVLDEFHERSVHTDLALAFLKECMALRTDLFCIVMSATIGTDRLSSYLGSAGAPAPVFSVPGRQFPVSIGYAGGLSAADAVLRELRSEKDGSILVFLPGIADIRRTAAELAGACPDADVLTLHSSVSFTEQRNVLEPSVQGSRRRVILSSAIAETSITVPGVTVVIDSGLARINRMNVAAGMETLSTENESVFSAVQRAGRAGRVGPGKCVRLWNEADARTAEVQPEILRTDLTQLVLECVQWGVYEPGRMSWLDSPSDALWNSALSLLEQLGCIVQSSGVPRLQITDLGKAALMIGLHPRLACAVLSGTGSSLAVAAGCALRYSSYAESPPAVQRKFTAALEQRVRKCTERFPSLEHGGQSSVPGSSVLPPETRALLAGFPDRLARLQDVEGTYRFPSGRTAVLPAAERYGSSGFPEWIVAPEADAGEREGKIYRYEPVPSAALDAWLLPRTVLRTESEFTGGTRTLRKTEYRCYGRLVLSERTVRAEQADFSSAVCGAVEKDGIAWLPLSGRTQDFLLRAQFYGEHCAVQSDKALPSSLQRTVREWLPPFLTGTVVGEDTVFEALRYYLDGAAVDRNVPSRITMPNGKSYPLSYTSAGSIQDAGSAGREPRVRPVLEIIIQRIFGCFETPRIMGVPVLLKLLSPANRPLQITDDLSGFWQNTWPEICKEMKGRYPKHNWDYHAAEKE